MAHCIYRQLLPELRAQIRYRDFETPEELIEIASEVEENLRELGQWRRSPAESAQNNRPAQQSNNTHRPQHQPPQRAENNPPRAITQGTSTALVRRTNNATNQNNDTLPPTACRFCQEWHWMRQCPRNPRNQRLQLIQQQPPQQHPAIQQLREPSPARRPENPQGAGAQ